MVDTGLWEYCFSWSLHIYRTNYSRNSLMAEAEVTTWINTILIPFMPVITIFIASALMLRDLPLNDDDGSGLITPVYNYYPQ